jgi:excisionase family DNA binding protein
MATKTRPMTAAEELCADGVVGKDEAAKRLDVSVRTLEKMMHDGTIPFTRSNKIRKIPIRAITQYLAERLVGKGL